MKHRTRQGDRPVELRHMGRSATPVATAAEPPSVKSKNETIAQAEKPGNQRSRRQREARIGRAQPTTTARPARLRQRGRGRAEASRTQDAHGPRGARAPPATLPAPARAGRALWSQASGGDMTGCDEGRRPIEWPHFSCAGLNHRGQRCCPTCGRRLREVWRGGARGRGLPAQRGEPSPRVRREGRRLRTSEDS